MPSDALQRGQYLRDGGTAAVERLAQRAFAVVQRLQPSLGLDDPLLGVAQAGGAVDQRLVEFAAIFADGVDLLLELVLGFRGLSLLGSDRLEFMIALAQRIERGLGVEGKGWEQEREAEHRGHRARRIGRAFRSPHCDLT